MKKGRNLWLPIAFLVLGVFLIVYGAVSGGAFAVFQKAVRICLECIGIG